MAAVALAIGGCASTTMEPRPLSARAEIMGTDGRRVALATFTEGPTGVHIEVTGAGLPPGPKSYPHPRCRPVRASGLQLGRRPLQSRREEARKSQPRRGARW